MNITLNQLGYTADFQNPDEFDDYKNAYAQENSSKKNEQRESITTTIYQKLVDDDVDFDSDTDRLETLNSLFDQGIISEEDLAFFANKNDDEFTDAEKQEGIKFLSRIVKSFDKYEKDGNTDLNGDGVINDDDKTKLIELADINGDGLVDYTEKQIYALGQTEEFKAKIAGVDGIVDANEYASALQLLSQGDEAGNGEVDIDALNEFDANLKLLDFNQDGIVSELERYLHYRGIDNPEAVAEFIDAADSDKDGLVSEEEIQQFFYLLELLKILEKEKEKEENDTQADSSSTTDGADSGTSSSSSGISSVSSSGGGLGKLLSDDITIEDIKKVKKLREALDSDENGKISLEELQKLFTGEIDENGTLDTEKVNGILEPQ